LQRAPRPNLAAVFFDRKAADDMLWDLYDRVTHLLLALTGFVMFALAIINAGMRYLFNSPLIWAEEISRYAMVWGTMIGVALAYRAMQHISITIVVDSLPTRLTTVCKFACHGLSLLTAYVLWRGGYVLVASLGFMAAPSSQIPMAWVFAAFPVGAVMLAVEVLRRVVADVLALRGETQA
jgi:TRAP-type C4-dicarboxylate transport system permease small subunit